LYVPLTAKVTVKLDATLLAGLPPVTAQAYVKGEVPPVTVEVKLSIALTGPVVGPEMDTDNGRAAMLINWKADLVLALKSVTVRVTLYVPLTANVVENVAAVPVAGLPPVTAQA
jgi:hypothetical protein